MGNVKWLCPLKLAPATVPRAFLIWKAMHSAVAKILQTSVLFGERLGRRLKSSNAGKKAGVQKPAKLVICIITASIC